MLFHSTQSPTLNPLVGPRTPFVASAPLIHLNNTNTNLTTIERFPSSSRFSASNNDAYQVESSEILNNLFRPTPHDSSIPAIGGLSYQRQFETNGCLTKKKTTTITIYQDTWRGETLYPYTKGNTLNLPLHTTQTSVTCRVAKPIRINNEASNMPKLTNVSKLRNQFQAATTVSLWRDPSLMTGVESKKVGKRIPPLNLNKIVRHDDKLGRPTKDVNVFSTFRRNVSTHRSPLVRPLTTPNYPKAPGLVHSGIGSQTTALYGSISVSTREHTINRTNPISNFNNSVNPNKADSLNVAPSRINNIHQPTFRSLVSSTIGNAYRFQYHSLVRESARELSYKDRHRSATMTNFPSPRFTSFRRTAYSLSNHPRLIAAGSGSLQNVSPAVTFQRQTLSDLQTTAPTSFSATSVPMSSSIAYCHNKNHEPVLPSNQRIPCKLGELNISGVPKSNGQIYHLPIKNDGKCNTSQAAVRENKYLATTSIKNTTSLHNHQPHQVISNDHSITMDPQALTAVARGQDPEKLLSHFLKVIGLK